MGVFPFSTSENTTGPQIQVYNLPPDPSPHSDELAENYCRQCRILIRYAILVAKHGPFGDWPKLPVKDSKTDLINEGCRLCRFFVQLGLVHGDTIQEGGMDR
jgi:hypothetical protein